VDRVQLFGATIDVLSTAQAVDKLVSMAFQPGPCRYVVTPNVDHVLLLQKHAELRRAYEAATLVLADGMPVVLASRLFGKRLPERVSGSDVVPALFSAVTPEKPLRVFLLGAAPGVAARAAIAIAKRYPGVLPVGVHSPPLGFENVAIENETILGAVAAAKPHVLVLGLGSPKQELWMYRHADHLDANLALCVGATIDFLAGEKTRAPRWMQQSGLEWFHRLSSEPRRLAGRYASNALGFPRLVWREWREQANASRQPIVGGRKARDV
jgi:N-acetylglucosaminyldiphosphoundecaprenol N-acetyl-beta-D-mannosaminyltransferase